MNFKSSVILAVGLLSAAPAFSATVIVNFEGATSFSSVNNYYNGGTDSAGASGPNLGVSFGGDALALSNDEAGTYFSNAPSPGTILAPVGPDAAMNYAGGFTGPTSFWYSAAADTSVGVYSGLNGTGTLLGLFSLFSNAQNGCSDTSFCHWEQAVLNIAGVAQSLQFGYAANVAGFDNITIKPVPLPAAVWLMLSGIGALVGFGKRRIAR